MIKRWDSKKNSGEGPAGKPAFSLERPERLAGPVIFASPHSGRYYPKAFRRLSRLDARTLRRSEDCFVDRLLEDISPLGLPVLTAVYARAYLDLNRAPEELDKDLFDDLDDSPEIRETAKVVAGFGVIPKMVGAHLPIYDGKLSFKIEQRRIEAVHRPYHDVLRGLLAEAAGEFGFALLIDCHSMPSKTAAMDEGYRLARAASRGDPDIVLGDRFGKSCASELRTVIGRHFQDWGCRVAHNRPYAGGYCTEHYGRPGQGIHAIQLEINRRLYMREGNFRLRVKGSRKLRRCLAELAGKLMALDLGAGLAEAAE